MPDEPSSLEARVDKLSAQLQALTLKVERMAIQLGQQPVEEAQPQPLPAQTWTEPLDASEELLSWAGKKSLLPRIATVCFLMVVALILRTLTDSGLIDKQIGSVVGMGYAALLIAFGWYKYGNASPLAPVFPLCGAALMATIVLETHARFASLPTMPAYGILMATGVATAVMGYLYRVAIPVIVGTLGLCLAGAAIDYPQPFFPLLGILLLSANFLGTLATRIHRCSWLRWILLGVTLFMQILWAFKLTITLNRGESLPQYLALPWFLPTISIFMVAFIGIALLGIVSSGSERISRFDLALPTINAVWTFTSAQYVVAAMKGSLAACGAVGIVAAAGHLGICAWLAGQKAERARGANAFALAGSVLLAIALPLALGNALLPLPLLGTAALALAFMAHKWGRGGVRFTSYLLQAYACVALAMFLKRPPEESLSLAGAVAAAVLAGVALFHYRWCRENGPPKDSPFFARFDKRDVSGVFLLMASLFAAFFSLRVGVYHLLLQKQGDIGALFHAAQSALINASAAGLVILAYIRRNKEVRNVAILVTVVGAVKVVLYDLLHIHGVPLVISVFSFGLAAAIESVALGRWQLLSSRKSEEQ